MTIEIWHKGKLLAEFKPVAPVKAEDLSITLRAESKMKHYPDNTPPMPAVRVIGLPVNDQRKNAEKYLPYVKYVIGMPPKEHPPAVYSNPRPYDF